MRDRLIELICDCPSKIMGANMFFEKVSVDLADYLLDKGVIVPPCKVGGTLWAIIRDTVRECQIHHYKIIGETLVICFEEKAYRGRHYEWSEGYIGVTLFKTKEEAEQALKGGGEE